MRWPHANVPLGLATYFTSALRGSLWMVVDAFVLLLPDGFGTNTNVGIMEGAAGIVNLFAAAAGGVFVDRHSRVSVLRTSTALSVCITALMAFAILYMAERSSTRDLYLTLVASSVLSGINRGVFLVAFEAIFGDSTPSGAARVRYYVWKQACATLGLCVGPLVAVLCFALTRDSWTPPELKVVILVCAGTGLLQGGLQLFFREIPRAPIASAATSLLRQQDGLAVTAEYDEQQRRQQQTSSTQSPLPINEADVAPFVDPRSRYVAPLLSVSSFFLGCGSGVAYKFIPLFCLKTLALSPIATHAIIAGMQLAATAIGLVTGKLARSRLGPIGVVVLFMSTSIGALAVVCFSGDLELPLWAVVAAMLVRGAFANACGGLTGSVLNDHITAENRGKWSIIGQLSRCTWSGSAFAGGVLVDRFSYRRAFLMPLGCHLLATVALLPLLAIVKPNRTPPSQAAKPAG